MLALVKLQFCSFVTSDLCFRPVWKKKCNLQFLELYLSKILKLPYLHFCHHLQENQGGQEDPNRKTKLVDFLKWYTLPTLYKQSTNDCVSLEGHPSNFPLKKIDTFSPTRL